jgi:hypothetical protein
MRGSSVQGRALSSGLSSGPTARQRDGYSDIDSCATQYFERGIWSHCWCMQRERLLGSVIQQGLANNQNVLDDLIVFPVLSCPITARESGEK